MEHKSGKELPDPPGHYSRVWWHTKKPPMDRFLELFWEGLSQFRCIRESRKRTNSICILQTWIAEKTMYFSTASASDSTVEKGKFFNSGCRVLCMNCSKSCNTELLSERATTSLWEFVASAIGNPSLYRSRFFLWAPYRTPSDDSSIRSMFKWHSSTTGVEKHFWVAWLSSDNSQTYQDIQAVVEHRFQFERDSLVKLDSRRLG